jgi:tetratricopeptide (TPR) repeat protein
MSTAEQLKDKGNAAFSKKDWSTAIGYYTKAIESEPDNHVYFSNRSAAYLKDGDANNALEDACVCIELNPDFVKGYARKGAALAYKKDYEMAIEEYSKGIEKCGDNNEKEKEILQNGIELAKRAKLETNLQKARVTDASHRASQSKAQAAKKSESVSDFVQAARCKSQAKISCCSHTLCTYISS